MLPRRLRKYLRDHTDWNIEAIALSIAQGRVRLAGPEGRVVPHEETLVFEEDEVFLDGCRVIAAPKEIGAYVLFKPKGVITTVRDPRGKRDLRPWLAEMPAGFFPVGRLDRETSGALLFANDGDLGTAILRPEHKLPKVYWLWLNESLTDADPRLSSWTEGLPILGGVARAEKVDVLNHTEHMTELLVTLREGKNRQIRRMCRFCDFRLLHLHRRSVGPVDLSGMGPGEMRRLSKPELTKLWESVGGKQSVEQAQVRALVDRAELARSQGVPLLRLESWLRRSGVAATQHASRPTCEISS